MQTLFSLEEIPCIKSVQDDEKEVIRNPWGEYTTEKAKRQLDRLRNQFRNQIVTLIRQRQSVYRQLRAKDEKIAELTLQIKNLKNENN